MRINAPVDAGPDDIVMGDEDKGVEARKSTKKKGKKEKSDKKSKKAKKATEVNGAKESKKRKRDDGDVDGNEGEAADGGRYSGSEFEASGDLPRPSKKGKK